MRGGSRYVQLHIKLVEGIRQMEGRSWKKQIFYICDFRAANQGNWELRIDSWVDFCEKVHRLFRNCRFSYSPSSDSNAACKDLISPTLATNKFSLPASCSLYLQYWMLSELFIQKLITVSTTRSTSQPRLGETVSTDATNASRVHFRFAKYSTPEGCCCCSNSCCWLKNVKVGDTPRISNV